MEHSRDENWKFHRSLVGKPLGALWVVRKKAQLSEGAAGPEGV